jgi:hypothetical protein
MATPQHAEVSPLPLGKSPSAPVRDARYGAATPAFVMGRFAGRLLGHLIRLGMDAPAPVFSRRKTVR